MTGKLARSIAVAALVAGLSPACHGEHLHPTYARQTRAFFSRQHVHAAAAEGAPNGLDSEESALIKASYRRNLGAQQSEPSGVAGGRVR